MKKSVLLVLLIMVFAVSCTTMKITDAQFSRSTVQTRSLGDFRLRVSVREWLGISGGPNILNISASAMDDAIRDAIMDEVLTRGGDAAVDVTIIYRSTIGNIIFNSITAGFYAPATAIITGTIVEYR